MFYNCRAVWAICSQNLFANFTHLFLQFKPKRVMLTDFFHLLSGTIIYHVEKLRSTADIFLLFFY